MENGGPRWAIHPRPISLPPSIELRPHERLSTWEGAVKLLGVEEDASVHPRAKEGGLCLHPTFVGTSPALAKGQGHWVGQGCGEEN